MTKPIDLIQRSIQTGDKITESDISDIDPSDLCEFLNEVRNIAWQIDGEDSRLDLSLVEQEFVQLAAKTPQETLQSDARGIPTSTGLRRYLYPLTFEKTFTLMNLSFKFIAILEKTASRFAGVNGTSQISLLTQFREALDDENIALSRGEVALHKFTTDLMIDLISECGAVLPLLDQASRQPIPNCKSSATLH